MATLHGARLLNRSTALGNLAPGFAADLAIYDLSTVEYAGAAMHDPLAALMMCHASRAKHVIVNGKVVVRNGETTKLDSTELAARLNELVRSRYR